MTGTGDDMDRVPKTIVSTITASNDTSDIYSDIFRCISELTDNLFNISISLLEALIHFKITSEEIKLNTLIFRSHNHHYFPGVCLA